MRTHLYGAVLCVIVLAASAGAEPPQKCSPDAVRVGPLCVDRYEASVWHIPESQTAVLKKARAGKVTVKELTAAGAVQKSPAPSCDPAFDDRFPPTGNWLDPHVALSLRDVPPTACVSWFQAEQACAIAGKRLLTNQEWQRAAAGTDSANCNVSGPATAVRNTGGTCVSLWGAFDMVGNVGEWVGDWTETGTGCTEWPDPFGADISCVGGDGVATKLPAAFVRGGHAGMGSEAGVYAIDAARFSLSSPSPVVGFRCAR